MRLLSALRWPCGLARATAMFAVLSVGLASCSQSARAIADVDALAGLAGDAVWQVEADGCGWRMRGSAFAVGARHLVTNRHVIANDSSPIIRSRDGKEHNGRVIGASTHPDVAVIEVAEDLPSHVRWAPTSSLGEQEPILVIGYPSPAYVFKTSTGQIVNFQGPDGIRESALVNAPIARGNSGGPGLRGDASVAGVVTQMTIRDKPEERVAILFTGDAVRPTVTRFIREPSRVLSSCGLGPDYVPPVPPSYDIKEAPAMARPVEALPVPSPASGAPVAAPTPRPLPDQTRTPVPPTPRACPEGSASVEVSELKATEGTQGPGWWDVEVRGLVRNESFGRIGIRAIEVTVEGEPPVTGRAGDYSGTLEAWQTTGWVLDERRVYSPSRRPTRAEATLDWYWLESRDRPGASQCPSNNVTTSGPSPTPTPTS